MAPQIITNTKHKAPANVNRGNIFEFLHSNPNKVDDNRPAYIRLDGKTVTRRQVYNDARSLAHAFRHRLGLPAGARIGILSPNSTYYPVAVHAGLCAGVVLVPMNAAYTAEELLHPIHDAEVEYLLCHQSLLPVARQGFQLAKKGLKSRNGQNRIWILDDGDDLKRGDQGEEDLRTLLSDHRLEPHKVTDDENTDAYIAYSSGTSGKPKGVQLTHRNITYVTIAACVTFDTDIGPDDVYLAVLPLNHIFGLAKFCHMAYYNGSASVVVPRFDLDVFCAAVQKHRCNIAYVVPPILVQLTKNPKTDQYNLSSLKWVLSGAAPLGIELSNEFEKKFPTIRVTQAWGLSETSPTATYTSYRDYRTYAGSCGHMVAGVEGRLVDDDGNDVGHEQGENGKPGEFWVRGPSIMRGYLNNKEATDDCITPDRWFKTGDIAIVNKQGYFWIVDRKKELIKFKGFQVPPAELEAVLLGHPKIADVAVIGVYDDSQATELPRAYVVPSEAAKSTDPAALAKEIVEWTASKVANHKRLRGGVKIVDVIPKSPSGKILRRIIRDEAAKEAKK
ncbi:uncharacterized protein PFL1_04155 [Pseudozyma flocculosa PF-1]|uniref:Related to 4-coumarate-CoA ligase n=2 Tax=Pseudozyma flocculosa TaxID=84751 RepID=A0A5C3ET85_9BASI|nr:uncharacterized protein PFL1_04155 [Pseudozyma flocculosa PF-1]EPQ28328.1 hypothetical protein PFL1_04155 [Pseudozyma flocculosa PF-1]SPO35478.1 related to 4-coumarate-CoA ligase [Pseudozyma flocculosa]